MAAEPKRSFKRTVASTVEGRSPRFLLSSLALAMVISILAGLVIGIQIGDDDKKTGKPTAIVNPTSTTRRGTAARTPRRAPLPGTVVRSTAKALFVSTKNGRVSLVLVPKSRIEMTSAATAADIKAGSRVLFVLDKPAGAGTTTSGTAKPQAVTAKEIIVVSGAPKNRIGTVVSSVTSDSMSFTANGKTLTISTAGAKVLKTVPGKRTNLTAGAHVLIKRYFPPAPKKKSGKPAVKRGVIAIEIVVLPAASAFA